MFSIRVSFQLKIEILTLLDISSTASLPLLQGPKYCSSAEAMTSSQQGPKIEKPMICTSLILSHAFPRTQLTLKIYVPLMMCVSTGFLTVNDHSNQKKKFQIRVQ